MMEILGLVLAIIILYLLFRIIKSATYILVNSVIGIILFFLLNMIGINVKIDLFSIAIAAIGGIPGVVLVVILHLLGLAF